MISRILKIALLFGILCSLSGCLISSSNRTYESGRQISPNTLAQVEVGTTTEDWVIATLGEPTSRTTASEDPKVEILRYTYERRHRSSGAVFLIFAGSTSKTTGSTTYFEVTDGIVTRHWSEH